MKLNAMKQMAVSAAVVASLGMAGSAVAKVKVTPSRLVHPSH